MFWPGGGCGGCVVINTGQCTYLVRLFCHCGGGGDVGINTVQSICLVCLLCH